MEGTEGMEGVVVDETPDPGSGGAEGAADEPIYYERRLERIDDGRWIAGVATGLADYFAIPVWLVRVIFLLLLGPAGLGFILYLALIAFMPHESEDISPAERMFGEMDSPGKWGGALIAVVGGLALLGAATNIDGGVLVAIALVAIGVILFQSSIGSRAAPTDEEAVATGGGGGRPPREPRPPKPPREPRPPRQRKPRERSNLGVYTLAAVLIGLGLLGSASILGWLFPGAVHYFALALLIVGGGLLVGAWFGRSRGLIVLGLALLPPVFATFAFANVGDFFDEWADDDWESAVTYVVETAPDSIDVGAGEITVDLTDTEWELGPGGRSRVTVDLGVGSSTLILPDDVDVDANLGVGAIVVDGNEVRAGFENRYRSGDGQGPVVIIDQGVGEIVIEGGER
jgi:phage shock protein PspC (stress-responsive transcriptional regulator)